MNTYQIPASTLTERLRLHYLEDREVSPEDKEVMIRWEAAHAIILSDSQNDRTAATILMKRFGISESTAYRDIRLSKNIFGDVRASTRDALRYMVTQWAIDLYHMAKEIKDLKGMERALERLTKANNLDKDDMDLPDASKIQPPVQLLSINFNLINSPRFKLIDEAAQKALLELYDQVMQQIVITPLGEYADFFAIDDSNRPNTQ
jgi:hypothetical protein